MADFQESSFRSSDGKHDIYVRSILPEGEIRGVVQLAHGISEHIDRYDAFAAFLAEHGYAVAGNDHLGHGRSISGEEDLGFFAETGGWEMVVEDMHQLHMSLAEQFPGKPMFLFGHSMGSFLSRTYIIRYRTGLDGVVLCGTGQQAGPVIAAGRALADAEVRRHGPRYRSMKLQGMAFGKYNDGFEEVRTVCDWLTRDSAVVERYLEDPLSGFISSASLFRDMMDGLSFIGKARNIERMSKDLPVFFIAGDKDPVGENGKAVIRVYEAFLEAGMNDATLKLYHDCRHELLNELNKELVMADILAWIEAKRPQR